MDFDYGSVPRPRQPLPMRSMTAKIAMKTKNRIFATPIDAPAIVVNPSNAAISPRTKNVKAQLSMGILLF